jgi:biopolymer transport protein ExbD
VNFSRSGKGENPGFQLAPMIDIFFLLLCFFIATQVYSQYETEMKVKLPTAENATTPLRQPGEIIVNIRPEGTIVVHGETYDEARLLSLLSSVVELFPRQPVLIRADKKTAYENVIRVIDLCREADVYNISFATQPADRPQP